MIYRDDRDEAMVDFAIEAAVDRAIDDVIAYLEQRRDNAATMAKRSPEFAEQARERHRQLGVIIDELRAGMHHGAAEARAAVLAPPIEGGAA